MGNTKMNNENLDQLARETVLLIGPNRDIIAVILSALEQAHRMGYVERENDIQNLRDSFERVGIPQQSRGEPWRDARTVPALCELARDMAIKWMPEGHRLHCQSAILEAFNAHNAALAAPNVRYYEKVETCAPTQHDHVIKLKGNIYTVFRPTIAAATCTCEPENGFAWNPECPAHSKLAAPTEFEQAARLFAEAIPHPDRVAAPTEDTKRLELAREAISDWRMQKLSDGAALFAISLAIMPQRKPTESDIERAKALLAADAGQEEK